MRALTLVALEVVPWTRWPETNAADGDAGVERARPLDERVGRLEPVVDDSRGGERELWIVDRYPTAGLIDRDHGGPSASGGDVDVDGIAEEQVSAALSADVRVKSGPPREQIGPDLPRLHASRLHAIYAATADHLPVPRPRRLRMAPEPYRGMRSRERLGNETPQKAEFG